MFVHMSDLSYFGGWGSWDLGSIVDVEEVTCHSHVTPTHTSRSEQLRRTKPKQISLNQKANTPKAQKILATTTQQ